MTADASPGTASGQVADLRQYEILVGGMTCAACATRVERKLNKLDAVQATVNFATERARVQCPEDLDPRTLIEQVERAGYTARRIDDVAVADDGSDHQRRVVDLRRRLAVAAVLAVPICDLSLALSLFGELRFPGWQWVLLVLAAPVVGWCALPFHRAALAGARRGAASMDTLVSVGILAATAWSLWVMIADRTVEPGLGQGLSVLSGSGHALYLDVAAGVTTFLLAGRYFEARAKRSAGSALRALLEAAAKDVEVLREDGPRRVPVSELEVGDRFVVRPGETVATDAVVTDGSSALDVSMVTGEPVPREVVPGDAVAGGAVNSGGRLVLRATRVGADTQLARMARLVQRAQEGKAGAQRLADRVAGVFVPAVLVLAVLTLVGWLVSGHPAGQAVTAAVAVLVVACPCALGLATPTAVLVGTGRGAQLGVFIKGPRALEATRAVDTIVLDKTGTLTEGRMRLADVRTVPGVDRARLLAMAGAVEAASEHPIAAAITAAASAQAQPLPAVTDFAAHAGLGARGLVHGEHVVVGRSQLFSEQGLQVPPDLDAARDELEARGVTVVLVGWGGSAQGVLAVADTVRPTSAAAVAALRGLGLHPVLVTGDNARTAATVAAEVGIDEVVAEVLPEGKVDVVRRLQEQGRSVAVVGDGVNDAAALAAADLGMAVGEGTDAAIEAADIVLGREDLLVVADAVELARRTHRTIRGNLWWAFGYNTAALPLAVVGLLSPIVAAAAMALSSVFVVTHSLRLRSFRPTEGRTVDAVGGPV
ncbi:heavy metal translocating P-type ATPase [Pseudonocardia xinjiangensis]|uniref:Heavy metal translocating P-type ATPase n=1 Tax=Pseudonocardia xinjiangensis TaxID=75289 RepID=A0ABX1RLZ0_9PSEU|nr:heavy metal translocating P-type ATPase [Pseudonocardia xinjiangensis]NMH80120.1 heavy metal translocating P-type ATPase [Pseudonocardia xinjiangensis]